MAKQTFTTGQVLTAAQVNSLQSNDFNQTVSAKTASYVLVAADKGTRIEFNTSGSVTCTVNTGLFDAGDTVIIQNRGAGIATITAGTATVNTSASLALNQYEGGILYFISASAAIFYEYASTVTGDITGVTTGATSGLTGGATSGTVDLKLNTSAKGDLLVGTGSGTSSALTVGSNGDTLVADSAATTGLRWSGATGQNPVINAAFQIWQRGTSFTATNGGSYFCADRWKLFSTTTGRTYTRQTTSDTTNLPNIQYCARVARDSGNTATNDLYIYQNFETVNSIPFAGKTVTLSFYARRGANFSGSGNNITAVLGTGTGTDQDAFYTGYTGYSAAISQSATLTTTWQRFTYTGTISTTANEMAIGFYYTPSGTAGAADYFEVTGVQLDLGSVALPFRTQNSTIQGELAACQRYYTRFNGGSTTGASFAFQGFALNGTRADFTVQLPQRMRVAPTALDFSNLRVYVYRPAVDYSTGTWALQNTLQDVVTLSYTHGTTVFTANDIMVMNSASAASTYFGLTAEL